MKNEYKKGSIAFFCFLLIVCSLSVIFAVSQVSAFKRAYNLKNYGREVKAVVVDFYITDAPNAYNAFVLAYEYRENDKTWGGVLQYSHRVDEKYDETALINYYKSQIGNTVEITIYEKGDYCQLTSKIESTYSSMLLLEVLFFSVGSIGFSITLIFYIRFLKFRIKN